ATDKLISAGGKGDASGEAKGFLGSTVKKPGKDQLKTMLWGLSPIHPQYLPNGAPLSAVLMSPLDFGVATFQDGELDQLGVEPPDDSIVFARLTTPLDSRSMAAGATVEALLTRPLFSPEHQLILPVGAKLQGSVTSVKSARK